MKLSGLIMVVVLFAATTAYIQAQINTNERARWFTDARQGMLIH